MPRPDLRTAIDALEEEHTVMQRQLTEIRSMINLLCERTGLSPRYPDNDNPDHAQTPANIKPDSFYGKRMQTAAREFLEMRKLSGLGPAKPRETFDALRAGGYQFEAKDDSVALVGLRAMLRKNSATFHKLPNGQYGLTVWYKNIKIPKEGSEDREVSSTSKRAVSKRKRGQAAKPRKGKKSVGVKKANPAIAPFVAKAIQDGSIWTTEKLKQEAIGRGVAGVDKTTKRSPFHVALLGLKSSGLAHLVEKGKWRAVARNSAGSGETPDPLKVIPMKAASA